MGPGEPIDFISSVELGKVAVIPYLNENVRPIEL